MTPCRITVDEARAYWAHPSQLEWGVTPDMLPEGPVYMACGAICIAFREAHWPGVWVLDFGAKPEGWGELRAPATAILEAFWREQSPQLIIGWVDERKRAALAFAKRCGATVTGRTALADGTRIVAHEWRPKWVQVV